MYTFNLLRFIILLALFNNGNQSLLSRIKNRVEYVNTTGGVIILPQDYYGEDNTFLMFMPSRIEINTTTETEATPRGERVTVTDENVSWSEFTWSENILKEEMHTLNENEIEMNTPSWFITTLDTQNVSEINTMSRYLTTTHFESIPEETNNISEISSISWYKTTPQWTKNVSATPSTENINKVVTNQLPREVTYTTYVQEGTLKLVEEKKNNESKPHLIIADSPIARKKSVWYQDPKVVDWPSLLVTNYTTSSITGISKLKGTSFKYVRTWKPYFPKLYLKHTPVTVPTPYTETTKKHSDRLSRFINSPPIRNNYRQLSSVSPIKFNHFKNAYYDYIILREQTTKTYTTTTTVSTLRKRQRSHRCYTCGLNVIDLTDEDCFYLRAKKILVNGTITMAKITMNCAKGPLESYRNGCFKRFLDIADTYVERGCRTNPATKGISFASRRLMMLESLLKNEDDGCAISPEASLVPFSRAISLYSRFHVCVCATRLCNAGTIPKMLLVIWAIILGLRIVL